jgi:hypothetical protein
MKATAPRRDSDALFTKMKDLFEAMTHDDYEDAVEQVVRHARPAPHQAPVSSTPDCRRSAQKRRS